MSNVKDNLPLPATDQDQTFMANLLAAVRAKREEATTKKGDKPAER